MKNDNQINSRHSLGKGEVESSILSGSTRKPYGMGAFIGIARIHSAVSGRTYTETRRSDGGKSVDSVRQPFTEDHMDFDITTVRKLTALRNKEQDFALKERLTSLLNTGEEINKETRDMRRREALIASFKKQWAEYLEAGGAV